jgi:flagellar protein FlaG
MMSDAVRMSLPVSPPHVAPPVPRGGFEGRTADVLGESVAASAPPEPASSADPQVDLGSEGREKEKREEKESLRELVDRLNETARDLGHRLSFDLYDVTDEVYAKVIDRRTNDVVKVLPPKEVLELHRKLQEALGAILDEQG